MFRLLIAFDLIRVTVSGPPSENGWEKSWPAIIAAASAILGVVVAGWLSWLRERGQRRHELKRDCYVPLWNAVHKGRIALLRIPFLTPEEFAKEGCLKELDERLASAQLIAPLDLIQRCSELSTHFSMIHGQYGWGQVRIAAILHAIETQKQVFSAIEARRQTVENVIDKMDFEVGIWSQDEQEARQTKQRELLQARENLSAEMEANATRTDELHDKLEQERRPLDEQLESALEGEFDLMLQVLIHIRKDLKMSVAEEELKKLLRDEFERGKRIAQEFKRDREANSAERRNEIVDQLISKA